MNTNMKIASQLIISSVDSHLYDKEISAILSAT